MIKEIKTVFENDYIRLGKIKIRPLSIAWWFIRLLQVIGCIVGMYIIYISVCCLSII